MPCPNIEKSIEPTSYMKPVYYEDYKYWRRVNMDGEAETVQFCKKIGRKKNVFECMNENEYKACRAYRSEDEGKR